MSTPETEALAVVQTEANAKLAALRAVKITSPQHKVAFAAALAWVQKEWKALDVREHAQTKPALEKINETRETYRGAKAAYKSLEEYLKESLHDYEVLCALEVGAATERAQALSAAGDVDGARAELMRAGESSDAALVDAPGMQVKHPWQWEVVNIEMLPREYLLANAKEIEAEKRRQLTAHPDVVPTLPGVKFSRGLQITGSKKK